jgi:hypothetical protein
MDGFRVQQLSCRAWTEIFAGEGILRIGSYLFFGSFRNEPELRETSKEIIK